MTLLLIQVVKFSSTTQERAVAVRSSFFLSSAKWNKSDFMSAAVADEKKADT